MIVACRWTRRASNLVEGPRERRQRACRKRFTLSLSLSLSLWNSGTFQVYPIRTKDQRVPTTLQNTLRKYTRAPRIDSVSPERGHVAERGGDGGAEDAEAEDEFAGGSELLREHGAGVFHGRDAVRLVVHRPELRRRRLQKGETLKKKKNSTDTLQRYSKDTLQLLSSPLVQSAGVFAVVMATEAMRESETPIMMLVRRRPSSSTVTLPFTAAEHW